MSYAMPGQPIPQEPKVRPTTVTAATWLLLLAAATYVFLAVLGMSQAGTFAEIFEEAYAGTELEGTGEFLGLVTAIVTGIFYLLFAVGFAVLALFDYRGKNPARIVTWVVGGVALCCTGVSLVFAGIDAAVGADLNGPDAAQLERMLDEALPGWYYPVTWTATGITVVALLAALILLAMPSANDFFRKPTPPPPPPPAYPQMGP
jgi:hypothetical protein